MAWAAGDVVFDFVGALGLARGLWLLADHLEGFWGERESAAGVALTDWSGVFADQFVERRDRERSSVAAVVAGLRGDARLWARAWASAMDEQNRVLWARHHEHLKNNRSLLESAGDLLGGFEDDTPHPRQVRVPGSPYFGATATLVRY